MHSPSLKTLSHLLRLFISHIFPVYPSLTSLYTIYGQKYFAHSGSMIANWSILQMDNYTEMLRVSCMYRIKQCLADTTVYYILVTVT